jgi:Fe-S-cluster-containing hydrogenase component 2
LKTLVVYPEKCSGCRICELICAYKHFKTNNPKKSAIRVFALFPKPARNVPIVCKQCRVPKCVEQCPTKALYIAEDKRILLDAEKCIGCRTCLEACPFTAIYFHQNLNIPIKCDLCDNDPECAKWCPTKALQFVTFSSMGQERQLKLASTIGGRKNEKI